MKKFLLISIVAIIFAFVLVGCGMGKNDATATPNRTTARPDRTATIVPTTTPDLSPTIENIEPTNPDIKDEIEGVIESVVPDMETMLPEATISPETRKTSASQYTDDEIRSRIRQMAWEQGYTVYDVRNDYRAMTENTSAIDLEKSLDNIREWDDMSSTRFVLKGNRINQVEHLEKVAEYKTPLLSKSQEAIANMEIANKTLQGICLLPGEEFSFVFFLGEVSEHTGYQEASTFVLTEDGEVKTKKGIGGGICQVASTLHGACQEMGAAIVERHPHSKPVSYIEEGKDAAISIGYKDFKFANTKEYTIVLWFSIADKTEIVEIYKL